MCEGVPPGVRLRAAAAGCGACAVGASVRCCGDMLRVLRRSTRLLEGPELPPRQPVKLFYHSLASGTHASVAPGVRRAGWPGAALLKACHGCVVGLLLCESYLFRHRNACRLHTRETRESGS